MSDESHPASMAEVLERIRTSRAELDRRIEGLEREQAERRPSDGGWSVKDHLAHIASWEAGAVALLKGEARHTAMGLDSDIFHSGDVDRVNAALDAANAALSYDEALARYRGVHADMLATLAGLSFEDLEKPYKALQPTPDAPTYPVFAYLAGNTWGHYDEHVPWIDRLLAEIEDTPATASSAGGSAEVSGGAHVTDPRHGGNEGTAVS